MIERTSALVLASCLLAAGAGYWWLQGGEIALAWLSKDEMVAERPAVAAVVAEKSASSQAEVRYEKAILACLLAASYGAERGARIDQVETLTRSLGPGAPGLSPDERREYDMLVAQLPDHRRERDASYALYFNGIQALSAAGLQQTAAAFDAVGKELAKAGLRRLTRYIPTIRRHIETSRGQAGDAARDERWIKELKNAVST
jgi:hypothetical protein